MGIRMSPSSNVVAERLARVGKRIEYLIQRCLMSLGEQVVAYVRNRPQSVSWYDHTGNLRSSIGYVISHDGRVVSISDFSHVAGGAQGSSEGKSYAMSLASSHRIGWALVVVAGMNYASYVEAIKGKDVLAGGELFARKKFPEFMKRLEQQIMTDADIHAALD